MTARGEKLSEAMRKGLALMAGDCGGIAGSDQYPAAWLGGRRTARALNRRGFIRMVNDHPGSPYRITPAGRRALQAEEESNG